jgi:hypothetical protein
LINSRCEDGNWIGLGTNGDEQRDLNREQDSFRLFKRKINIEGSRGCHVGIFQHMGLLFHAKASGTILLVPKPNTM